MKIWHTAYCKQQPKRCHIGRHRANKLKSNHECTRHSCSCSVGVKLVMGHIFLGFFHTAGTLAWRLGHRAGHAIVEKAGLASKRGQGDIFDTDPLALVLASAVLTLRRTGAELLPDVRWPPNSSTVWLWCSTPYFGRTFVKPKGAASWHPMLPVITAIGPNSSALFIRGSLGSRTPCLFYPGLSFFIGQPAMTLRACINRLHPSTVSIQRRSLAQRAGMEPSNV